MSAAAWTNVDSRWLVARGNLHDARITRIDQSHGNLVIGIDDQWKNFDGLESYPGPESGALVVEALQQPPHIDPGVFREMISEATVSISDNGVGLVVECFGQNRVEARGRKVIWQSGKGSD